LTRIAEQAQRSEKISWNQEIINFNILIWQRRVFSGSEW
jgi:hypothetical protein